MQLQTMQSHGDLLGGVMAKPLSRAFAGNIKTNAKQSRPLIGAMFFNPRQ